MAILKQTSFGGIVSTPTAAASVAFLGADENKGRTTGPEHTTAQVKVTYEGSELQVRYALWGSNNQRPQDIIAEMNKNGVAKAGLRIRSKSHFGAGPAYFRDRGAAGMDPVPMDDPALAPILEWHTRNRLPALQRELINAHEWWGMGVQEFVVSQDLRQVVSARVLKSAWVRWSLMDNTTGRIEWCLYNPNWGLSDNSQLRLIPVADPWWSPDELRAWLKVNGFRKFILPTWIPDPDMGYYPDVDWHAVYDNGWLSSTNRIPGLKDAIQKNQSTIKYHIRIPMSYFAMKYKDSWATMTEDQRAEKQKETLELIDGYLRGEDNAGKSLITYFETDEMGQPLPGWEIITLDDKLKDGAYIPDSEKGNSEILASMAVDPTLLGQGAPGGKLGAGSGSDKREAIVILQALQHMDRDMTTENWRLISRFNGWAPDVLLGYLPLRLPVMDSNMPTPGTNPTPPAP